MSNGNESKPSQNKWAVMGGIALNVEYTRKYGFEATAAARVTAKLVAIPPPTLFQEAVQADIAGRAKRAAALVPPAPALVPPAAPPLPPGSGPGVPPPAAGDDDIIPLSLRIK